MAGFKINYGGKGKKMVKERVQTWFHFRGLETLLNKFNALIVEKFLFLPSHEIFSAFLVQDFLFMVTS